MTNDIRLSMESLTQNDISIAEEKGAYTTFLRRFTIYRRGSAPSHFVNESDRRFQLPDNSAVHFVTHFLDPSKDAVVDPDLSLPFIQNEVWRKFYTMVGDIPSPTDPLLPVTDQHIFQKGSLKSTLMRFYMQHPNVKRLLSDGTAGRQKNALLLYDYGILQRTRLMGIMKEFRLTDLILRSILHRIVTYPYRRNHFIYIPLSNKYYSRSKFTPLFKEISNSRLKEKHDPSFDFLIHLLGFVYGFQYPQSGVTLIPNDATAIAKGTLHLSDQPSTSIFNRFNDDQLSQINIILEHGGECVIYNLKTLKEFSEKGSFFLIFYKHIMGLKEKSLEGSDLTEYKKEMGDVDKEVDSLGGHTTIPTLHEHDVEASTKPSGVHVDGTTVEAERDPLRKSSVLSGDTHLQPKHITPTEAVKTVIPKSEPVEEEPEDTEVEDHPVEDDHVDDSIVRDHSVDSFLDVEPSVAAYVDRLPPAEQKRARKHLEKLNTITLGGRTLRDHLETPSKSLESAKLVGDHVTLIDESTRSTKITSFDQQYLDGNFHRDIAKTVTSFMTQGFFVSDISESKEITRLNRTHTYRVKFVSVDGNSHIVHFTVPLPDKEGLMMDNGVEYRLIKQKTSVPIAKVSPWRVALFSSYNKSQVERTRTRRSYGQYILRIIDSLIRKKLIKPQYGHLTIDSTPLPLEYSFIAERYSKLSFKGLNFIFDFHHRFEGLSDETVKSLREAEKTYGVYCGKTSKKQNLFFSMSNTVVAVDGEDIHKASFIEVLDEVFPDASIPSVPNEYTLVKIISQNYSLIFLLGLIHGLTPTLNHIKARYNFYPKGKRVSSRVTDIKIKFKNGTLVVNRYPLLQSFIISGLQWCNTEDYDIEEFDKDDVYYSILERKGISTNHVKGIRSFFDLFIDPITKEVLTEMREPTNTTDLLIRATEMLTTQYHYPASSERHYRFRSYERFPSIIYNEIARSIATYKSDRTRGRKLDVNPQAVYQKIVSDPARISVDIINPIHEIKDVTKGSYAGIGGRTSRSFVVNDRTYSPDSVGVISEATPDSGKVGMIFNTVMDPNIIDLYGRTIPHDGTDTGGSGAKLMSVVGNLLPGLAQDDSLNCPLR